MREIKFRAWHSDKMFKYGPFQSFSSFFLDPGGVAWFPGEEGYANGENHDAILMQFTGLKDKNGAEIYEGDIVKLYPRGEILLIFWESERAKFSTQLPNGIQYASLSDSAKNWIEVIGNIYENPELLQNK